MHGYTITQDNGPHSVTGTGFMNRTLTLRSISHALRDGRMMPTAEALGVMEALAGSDTASASGWTVQVTTGHPDYIARTAQAVRSLDTKENAS